MTMAFLNGAFMPLDQASISPLDRGFLLGDGVYEIIPVFGGRLFRLEAHLNRLFNSLRLIHLDIPYTREQLTDILQALVTQNGGKNQSVYLQITRGNEPSPIRTHAFPAQITPTIFITSKPSHTNSKAELVKGVKAITLADNRWDNCEIKAITLLANVLNTQAAQQAGAKDAILIRNGHAIEGASSNIFIVKDGLIITPPLSPIILGGVTRSLVIELAQKHQMPLREADIPESDLATADELWITSSTKDILPVLQLNDAPVSDGKPGPVWHTLIDYYLDYRDYLRKTP